MIDVSIDTIEIKITFMSVMTMIDDFFSNGSLSRLKKSMNQIFPDRKITSIENCSIERRNHLKLNTASLCLDHSGMLLLITNGSNCCFL